MQYNNFSIPIESSWCSSLFDIVLLLPLLHAFASVFFSFSSMEWNAERTKRVCVCAARETGNHGVCFCSFSHFHFSSHVLAFTFPIFCIFGVLTEWVLFCAKKKQLWICVYCMICLCYFQQTKRINANIIHVTHTIFVCMQNFNQPFHFPIGKSQRCHLLPWASHHFALFYLCDSFVCLTKKSKRKTQEKVNEKCEEQRNFSPNELFHIISR